jgi:hypothetical protein
MKLIDAKKVYQKISWDYPFKIVLKRYCENSDVFGYSYPVYLEPSSTPYTTSCQYPPPHTSRARIFKHVKVTTEKIALGKVNFSNGILKQPDFSLKAVCHCD